MTIPLLFLFLLFSCSSSSSSSSSVSCRTAPSDVVALKAFKWAISASSINPWSCLATWNFSSDPCRPQTPSHFTCGLSCASCRVTAITLDPAGYSGLLSPSLSALSLLTHLSLFDNSFHGPIAPSLFSSLPSLQTLLLSSNHFSGPIPLSLSRLRSLQTLDLSRNQFTGPVPTFPPNSLPNLLSLDLSFNSLSGPLPDSLPPNLVELALRGNLLTGSIRRPTFEPLGFLEVVELAANRIDGSLEGWFFLLPSIQQVDLANNSITSLDVSRRGSADGGERLVAVDLSFNQIGGALSPDFAKFPSLASLSARHNRLRGQIPWQLKRLKRLFLDGNFLNGGIPDGFFDGELVAGSFGDNCLESCPRSVAMCSPVQKPDWVCKRVYGAGGPRRSPRRPSPAGVH